MNFRDYNDFEIIDLVKQGNDEAFNFMVTKYQYLIAKKIKSFNLTYEYEDCFQETLMLLHKSLMRFDENYNKTFTRYFELNLNNFLITYKGKKQRHQNFISEKLPLLYDFRVKEHERNYYLDNEIYSALSSLSDFEKQVYQAKIIEDRNIKECAVYLNCEEKQVYNAIARIRNKIKLHLMT